MAYCGGSGKNRRKRFDVEDISRIELPNMRREASRFLNTDAWHGTAAEKGGIKGDMVGWDEESVASQNGLLQALNLRPHNMYSVLVYIHYNVAILLRRPTK